MPRYGGAVLAVGAEPTGLALAARLASNRASGPGADDAGVRARSCKQGRAGGRRLRRFGEV
ncbi:hypothetical protein GCM10022251_28040 [Phytohabitans flavus]|uniref:Uncharacterized protein n=1 Tax=Phytohabitans flavus TaxID=1076124 RepID=A0A6F8XP33_9ACTN|nr:hypothetical protein [Phytohabitans flavus]BCB75583.1 hypothetical protein Pflav_019930 [Phytohabitans flavus]